jgi:hypothetical protein
VSSRCGFHIGPVLQAVLLLHPAPLGVLMPKPFLGMARSPTSFFCVWNISSDQTFVEGTYSIHVMIQPGRSYACIAERNSAHDNKAEHPGLCTCEAPEAPCPRVFLFLCSQIYSLGPIWMKMHSLLMSSCSRPISATHLRAFEHDDKQPLDYCLDVLASPQNTASVALLTSASHLAHARKQVKLHMHR